MAGNSSYRLKYSKGQYFRVGKPLNVTRLTYPVPNHTEHSLGIHLTPDLAGSTRFGPDAHFIDNNTDYSVDEKWKPSFLASIQRYLPAVQLEDLTPDTAAIRPKLQGIGDPFHDFVISKENNSFINLVGIESPGLTSSLAIAEYIEQVLHPSI
jgi:L-2-hydroxyglutarate oxidase LhgO